MVCNSDEVLDKDKFVILLNNVDFPVFSLPNIVIIFLLDLILSNSFFLLLSDKYFFKIDKLSEWLRKILVNVTKIQSVYPDISGKTIIQLRRENIKTEESYEQVVTQIKESIHYGNV